MGNGFKMRYDLHTHTRYSKCSNLKPGTLLKVAKKRKLNGIAVTDHHSIKGALEAKKLNKDRNFEVIVGEEISTNLGDVLVYFLNKKIDKIDFYDAVKEARKQNALVVIPHPFRWTPVYSHKFKTPIEKVKGSIDAIECFNARMFFNSDNKTANIWADKLGIAKTGGSDAHFFFEIGRGYTIFEGKLRDALRRKKTDIGGNNFFGPIGGVLSFLRKI